MSGFNFLSLNENVRRMIADRMDCKDRCRFGQSSKFCFRQATGSKKAVEGIAVRGYAPHLLRVSVIFGRNECGVAMGYFMDFVTDLGNGQKYVVYCKMMPNNEHKVKWTNRCDRRSDMTLMAMQYFARRVNWYNRAIKSLSIAIPFIPFPIRRYDVQINYGSLSQLAQLEFGDESIAAHVFATLRRPLRDFRTHSAYAILPDEVCQIRDTFIAPRSHLTRRQFERLFAGRVEIALGDLGADTIVAFIREWQSGVLRRNFVQCIWYTSDSCQPFCKAEMMFALGYDEYIWRQCSSLLVASFDDPYRTACLFHTNDVVAFTVN